MFIDVALVDLIEAGNYNYALNQIGYVRVCARCWHLFMIVDSESEASQAGCGGVGRSLANSMQPLLCQREWSSERENADSVIWPHQV